MKIVTVVGARPQFVKAAAVSRKLREHCEEILVHTGQHYDANMSDIFFKELEIPKANYNLGIGSGSHAVQTGQMMEGLEKIFLEENPDYVMVYGDTNSTLAGSLAAVKIHIPVVHVEAGLRSYNNNMPEEINRILTDRISSLLFCPTQVAVDNLKKEGIVDGVYNIGDVMCDAVMYYGNEIETHTKQYYFDRIVPFKKFETPQNWYLATIHRAENTDSLEKIREILNAFQEFDEKVIFTVHPRTKGLVKQILQEKVYDNVILIEPVGYIDMLYLTKNAKKVVTDSGGLQKESYILKTPCVTIRDQTEWIETLVGNWNILSKPNKSDIIEKVKNTIIDKELYKCPYGTGDAARKLIELLINIK